MGFGSCQCLLLSKQKIQFFEIETKEKSINKNWNQRSNEIYSILHIKYYEIQCENEWYAAHLTT